MNYWCHGFWLAHLFSFVRFLKELCFVPELLISFVLSLGFRNHVYCAPSQHDEISRQGKTRKANTTPD